jgi:hypothetical protein
MRNQGRGEPFTVRDLKDAIARLPDDMWVFATGGDGGTVRAVIIEWDAQLPFIMIDTEPNP